VTQNSEHYLKTVEPPKKEDGMPSGSAGCGCLTSVIFTGLLLYFTGDMSYAENPSLNFWHPFSFIAVLICVFWALGSMKNNPEANAKYLKAMKKYERKRVCMRCGNIYLGPK
jgi:hypothetical protein